MRKRWLIIGLPALVVASVVAFLELGPDPAFRISLENCERIRSGMTMVEVENILGPPGGFSNRLIPDLGEIGVEYRQVFDDQGMEDCLKCVQGTAHYEWYSDALLVAMDFGKTGRVAVVYCYRGETEDLGPYGLSSYGYDARLDCYRGETVDLGPWGNFRRRVTKLWHRCFP
jgi:hypothetical protein